MQYCTNNIESNNMMESENSVVDNNTEIGKQRSSYDGNRTENVVIACNNIK